MVRSSGPAASAIFDTFAATRMDGSVVAWGHPAYGGDNSGVADQLQKVEQVQATEAAFAAIRGDGSVVTWGHPDFGGNSNAVQHQLKNVQQLQATRWAFAALLADGSVVADSGGDSSTVQNQLHNLQQVDSCEVEDQLQKQAGGSGHTRGMCCHCGRWIRRHMG